jgi:hypothetical protein
MPNVFSDLISYHNSLIFNNYRIQLFLNQFQKSSEVEYIVKNPDTDCKNFQTSDRATGSQSPERLTTPGGDQRKQQRITRSLGENPFFDSTSAPAIHALPFERTRPGTRLSP